MRRCRAELCPFWTGDGCVDGVLVECEDFEPDESDDQDGFDRHGDSAARWGL